MSSLQLIYNSVMPAVAQKDPALAKKLQTNYASIMSFLDHVEAREKKGNKLTILEIEEMAYQAKGLTDQLVPELKQVVALLNLKLPPKPILA
jgi:iron uptake system EfeUOB component EfeO/EfeM